MLNNFQRQVWCVPSTRTYFICSQSQCKWWYLLFNVIDINETIQGSSRNMPAMKKGKLCINILQVNGTEWVHTLWPMKFCPKAVANLLSLMCELSQKKKISSDYQNNIVVKSTDGDIILDCQIKTCNGLVARDEFLQEIGDNTIGSQPVICIHETSLFYIFYGQTTFFSKFQFLLNLRSVCCFFCLCGMKIFQYQFLLMWKSFIWLIGTNAWGFL